MSNPNLATPKGAEGPSAEYLHSLPVLPSFYDSGNLDYYRPLPDDWWIAATDVIDSTKAIQDGRYREVNMLGAATIIGLLNCVAPDALPFAFGGDGALVCLPSQYKERAQSVLGQLSKMAETALDLKLRTGLMPYKMMDSDQPIMVGKYNLSPDATQYSFLGNGVQHVDNLLKSEQSIPQPEPDTTVEADFSGLECRWKPIKSPTGVTLTVLVEPYGSMSQQLNILNRVLNLYQDVLGEQINNQPLHKDGLQMSWNPLNLMRESKVVAGLQAKSNKWSRWLDTQWRTMVGSLLMDKEIDTDETAWSHYKEDLITHSDYRKVDGLLRFVASVTVEQKRQLINQLGQWHDEKLLGYGTHESDAALVTCMISHYHKAHLHFVDGSDGGYAEAARMLKQQSEP